MRQPVHREARPIFQAWVKNTVVLRRTDDVGCNVLTSTERRVIIPVFKHSFPCWHEGSDERILVFGKVLHNFIELHVVVSWIIIQRAIGRPLVAALATVELAVPVLAVEILKARTASGNVMFVSFKFEIQPDFGWKSKFVIASLAVVSLTTVIGIIVMINCIHIDGPVVIWFALSAFWYVRATRIHDAFCVCFRAIVEANMPEQMPGGWSEILKLPTPLHLPHGLSWLAKRIPDFAAIWICEPVVALCSKKAVVIIVEHQRSISDPYIPDDALPCMESTHCMSSHDGHSLHWRQAELLFEPLDCVGAIFLAAGIRAPSCSHVARSLIHTLAANASHVAAPNGWLV
mmetsp:Transcript_74270/g.135676  ORF Transcript_74270/g.135676 Transcript_74270/m.135676 type:complete len:345 (-) Transcript_74270:1310-2344(-)